MGLFSDDDLMDTLVLKGGNALDIIHGIAGRSSLDLDFSMQGQFEERDLDAVQRKVARGLETTFRERGYEAFDVKLAPRPLRMTPDMAEFWGGYRVEFKLMEASRFAGLAGDSERLRKNAIEAGPGHMRRFLVDISSHEYCENKQEAQIDGLTVYVYTPVMIAAEKLRAICQQMPEYRRTVKSSSGAARARDFFDIYIVMTRCPVDLSSDDNGELLRNMFLAKKVPLRLLGEIENHREFHRQDFAAVEATVEASVQLRDFDFYFDFVVNACKSLEALWVE